MEMSTLCCLFSVKSQTVYMYRRSCKCMIWFIKHSGEAHFNSFSLSLRSDPSPYSNVINIDWVKHPACSLLQTCELIPIFLSVLGSLDAKIFLFYTADWTTMNVIDDDVISPVVSLDVSQDSTFLMAGENALLYVFLQLALSLNNYANMSMQYTANFIGYKIDNFQFKVLNFVSQFCPKRGLWVHVRTAS